MTYLPIDVTAVLATVLGLMTLLIPVAGFTMRFALKPLVETLAVAWTSRNAARQEMAILEKRVALLERELELRRLPAVAAVSEVPAAGATVASLRSFDRT